MAVNKHHTEVITFYFLIYSNGKLKVNEVVQTACVLGSICKELWERMSANQHWQSIIMHAELQKFMQTHNTEHLRVSACILWWLWVVFRDYQNGDSQFSKCQFLDLIKRGLHYGHSLSYL